MSHTGPRFYDFREIEARFDSVGYCGHPIKKGDSIGYSRRFKRAYCALCWEQWVGENEEADFLERSSAY